LAISKQKSLFSLVSVAKPRNIIVFAYTYMLESFSLHYGDFCMDFFSVNSDEALNASSLQFLRNIKRLIDSLIQILSQR
jgi:hypothetical protein